MSIDKRLISTDAPAGCTTDALDIFGDSSCVALYGLNYDTSDASGNYNGTPTDVTFNAPGYIDYAASFNGSSSRIQLPSGVSAATGNNDFTLSAWVYLDTMPSAANFAASVITTQDNYYFYIIIDSAGAVRTYNQNFALNSATGVITTGQWYNIVATLDSTNGKNIYVNGTNVATSSDTSNANTFTNGHNAVGYYSSNGSTLEYFLDGKIDQVRIFNKGLSAAEVTTLYGEVACQYTCTTDTNGFPATASSNLAAYWKFDNDATDETGSYNGTLNGTNTWVGGRYGSSYKSNGSTGYISTSLTLPSTNYAFSYWAYNNGADQQSIIGTEGSNVGISMRCRFATNQIAWNNWNVEAYEPTVSFKEGWNHVVQQISSNGKQIYLNGSLAASNSTTSITNNSTVGVRIGGYPPFSYFSSCPIDQIRYYTKALSSTEVSAIYEEEYQCYITVDSTDPFGDSSNLALYEFENNGNDSLGTYNLTASNVTYSTDSIIGTYAASFNGNNSSFTYGSITGLPTGTSPVSISYWVYTDTSSHTAGLVGYGRWNTGGTNSGAANAYFGTMLAGGNLYFAGYYYNTAFSPAVTLPTGQWNHLVWTFDGTNLRAYLNGSLAGTVDRSSLNIGGGSGNLSITIGRNSWSSTGSEHLNGKIDQTRFFNKALDGDEVWKLYAEGAKG